DELERALEHGIDGALSKRRDRLAELRLRLTDQDVRRRLTRDRRALGLLERSLHTTGAMLLEPGRRRYADLTARLDALSPLKVLGRGYAVVLSERTGRALLRPSDAVSGDILA